MFEDLVVVYAEDEDFVRETLVETLEFLSVKVYATNNGEDAYKKYLELKPDIVIADIEMPKLNGLQLASKIRQNDKNTQIIITTAYNEKEYLLKAVELNLVKYLLKPIDIMELKNALTICKDNLKSTNKNKLKYFNTNSYYDLTEHKLFVEDKEVHLTFNETRFFELLLKSQNQLVPYEQIEISMNEHSISVENLRTLVKTLRKKLPDGVVHNVAKSGYRVSVIV